MIRVGLCQELIIRISRTVRTFPQIKTFTELSVLHKYNNYSRSVTSESYYLNIIAAGSRPQWTSLLRSEYEVINKEYLPSLTGTG